MNPWLIFLILALVAGCIWYLRSRHQAKQLLARPDKGGSHQTPPPFAAQPYAEFDAGKAPDVKPQGSGGGPGPKKPV